MACSSIIWTILPLFIADLGATKTQIGFIRMISTAIAIVFGPSLGEISDKIGFRRFLAQNATLFYSRVSSLFTEQTGSSHRFIENPLLKPSMQQTVFRTFPTRMEFLQLIV